MRKGFNASSNLICERTNSESTYMLPGQSYSKIRIRFRIRWLKIYCGAKIVKSGRELPCGQVYDSKVIAYYPLKGCYVYCSKGVMENEIIEICRVNKFESTYNRMTSHLLSSGTPQLRHICLYRRSTFLCYSTAEMN